MNRRNGRVTWFVAALAVLIPCAPALRAAVVWTAGSTTDTNWSNVLNWDTNVPLATDDVTFDTPIPNPGLLAQPETITLGAGSVANSLTLKDDYTLTGGALALTTGNVTVAAGKTATINSALTAGSGLTLVSAGGGGTLNLGAAANAYTGTTTVNAGTLVLSGATSRTGATTINTGGTLSAAVATGTNPLGSGAINLAGGTLDLTPTANTSAAGLSGRTFTTGLSSDTARINFTGTAATTRTDATLNYGNVAPVNATVGIQWLGKLNITTGGAYTFQIGSDDGSRLWIDGVLVVQNDGPKGVITGDSAPITLSAGLHDVRVDYVNSGGGGGVNLRYAGPDPGGTQTVIPSTALFQAESNTVAGSSNAVVIGTGVGNDLNVSGTSTINLNGSAFTQAQLGNSTFASGSTLNVVTSAGINGKALRIGGTATFGTGVTLNGVGDGTNGADIYFDGVLSDGGVATTISKTGNGRLIFGQTDAANSLLAGSTLDIQAGTLHLVGSSATGSFNPIGSAGIALNGGNVVLDSKVGSATAATTFNNAIVVNQNATIQDIVTGGSLVTLGGSISIAATQTLTLDAIAGGNPASSLGAQLRVTGALSGSGNLAVASSNIGVLPNTPVKGMVLLAGDNSAYTGTITVPTGISLGIGHTNAIKNATVNVATGAGLSFLFDASGTAVPETVNFDGSPTFAGDATFTVGRLGTTYAPLFTTSANKTAKMTGALSMGASTYTVNNNNGYALELGNTVTMTGAPTFSVVTITSSSPGVQAGLNISGQLTGAFGLTKTGVGTMKLSNDAIGAGGNDFTGTMTVLGGVLGASSDQALGNAANAIDLVGLNATISSNTTNASATVTMGSTAGLYVGAAVTGTNIPANATITAINSATSITISANATGTGTNNLTYSSSGSFEAFGTFATSRTFTFSNASTAGNLMQVSSGNTLTLNSVLTGVNGFRKSDPGILVLAGNNAAFDGAISASGGITRVTHNNALGTTVGATTVEGNSGTALQFDAAAAGGTLTIAEPFTLNGTIGVNGGGALQAISGTTTLSGAITLANAISSIGATTGATIEVQGGFTGAQNLNFSGAGDIIWSTVSVPAAGTAPSQWGKNGTGKLTVTVDQSVAPAITGAVTLNGGTVEFSGAGKLGSTGTNIIGQATTVILDNSGTNVNNRLNTRPVWFGGNLTIIGNAGASTTETFGNNLTPSNVGTVITLLPDAAQPLNLGGGWSRNGTSTVLLRGTGLGNAPGNGVATAKFTTGVTVVGQNGVVGTSSRGIVPAVLVDQDGAKFGQSFAAYDATTNGFQPLGAGETAATLLNSANVRTGAAIGGAAGVNFINSLTLDNGGGVTLGTGSVLMLDSGGLLAFTGNAGISGGAVTTNANRELIAHVLDRDGTPGASLNVTSTIGGFTGGLTKAGNGNLQLSAKSYYTGATTINGGTLTLNAGTNTILAGQAMVLNYGGTLDLNGNVQLVGDLYTAQGGGTETIRFGGNVTGSAGSILATTLGANRTFGGSLQGAMTFVRAGGSTLTLVSDNTHTGGTMLIGGTTTLTEGGRLSGSGSITIINGTLMIDNNSGLVNDNDRVNDLATITLRTGQIQYKNRAQTLSTENFGALVLAQGNSELNVGDAAGTGINAPEMRFASITQSPAAYNGGTGLDATTNLQKSGGQVGSAPRTFFGNGVALLNNNILPVWIENGGTEFVSYTSTLGVMPLSAQGAPGYTGTTLPTVDNATSATGNYSIGASGVVPTGGLTVNTLNINGAFNVTFGTTSSTDVLNIGAGGLIKRGTTGSAIGSVVDEGRLTAGGASPVGTVPFHIMDGVSGNSFTINSRIIDNGASPIRLIINNYNGGTVVLTNGNNSYTGGTVVNGWIGNGSGGLNLGGAAGQVVIPAGGLTINNSTVTMATNNGQINSANTVYMNGSATLTLVGANTLNALSFDNSGGTTNPTVNTGGALTLSAGTPIVVTSSNTGSVATVAGTLDFGGNAKTFSIDSIKINGQVIAPLNATANITAVIQNAGLITKTGTGNLQLSGQSTFTGGVTVSDGGLIIGANSVPVIGGTVTSGPVGTGTLTVASGKTLLSGGAFTIANALTASGDLNFAGANNLTIRGATSLSASPTIDVDNPNMTAALLGTITGAAGGITKTGLGTLALNPTAYSGNISMPGGGSLGFLTDGDGTGATANILAGSAITTTGSTSITVGRNGATYSPYFPSASNKNIQVNLSGNGLSVTNNNGYGLEVLGTTTLSGGDTIFNVATASASNTIQGLTLTGNVTGAQGIIKTGAGALVLNNNTVANNFGGAGKAIDIQGGVVSVSSDQALGDAANAIKLNIAGTSGVGLRATGTFTTARTIEFAKATNAIEVTSGNTLTLSSAFTGLSGTTTLVKNDNGVLELAAANSASWTGTYTLGGALVGGVQVNAGYVKITDSGALGASTNPVVVFTNTNAGIQLANNVTIPNPLTINHLTSNAYGGGLNWSGQLRSISGNNTWSGLIQENQDAGISADLGSTLNLTGGINQNAHILILGGAGTVNVSTGAITGVHSLDKIGSGTANIQVATAAPTGNGIRVFAGDLTFSGAGAVSGAGAIATIINPGGTLNLDNSGGVTANRLGGRVMTLAGGNLNLIGGAAVTGEAIGAPSFNRGQSTITVTDGGAGTDLSFTAASNNVNPAQTTGGSMATVLFRGTSLGTAAGAGVSTIRWTAGGLLFNGQTGATGTTTKGLAPWAIIDTTAAGLGTSFVTADSAAGGANTGTNILRPLAANEYSTATTLAANANMLITTAITGANTVAPNSLTIDTGGSIAINAGQTLSLSSGGILVRNGVASTISGGIVSQPAGNSAWNIHTVGTASLTVSSLMSGGRSADRGGLVKAGGGTLTLSTPTLAIPGLAALNGFSANTLNMQTVVNQGTLVLNGGTNTLATNNYLEVGPGGTLDLNGTAQFVRSLYTDGTYNGIANSVTAGGTITSTAAATLVTNSDDRNWAGQITGNVFYNKSGTGNATIYTPQPYTGATLINAGTMTLRDYAALSGTSAIGLNYASLTLNNGGSADMADRIGDSVPLTLRGGTLTYSGRVQTASSETLGTITLAEGLNVINVTAGGTGVNSAVLTTNLARPVGANATVILGALSGTVNQNGQIGSAPRMVLTAPSLTNNLIGPWAIISREWASHIPGLGVGQLNANGFAGYATNVITASPLATDNIRVTAGFTLASPTTVNTLNLTSFGATSPTINLGAQTLTLAGGGLMIAPNSDNQTATVSNGTITSGYANGAANDLYLYHLPYAGTNRQSVISAVVADNGATPVRLVVTSSEGSGSSQRTTLTGINTHTGGTVVNLGTVVVGANGVIPAGGITLNSGTLTQALASQATVGVINSANVVTLNGPSTLNLVNNNTLAGLVFNNTGGNGNPTVNTFIAGVGTNGTGTLTLGAGGIVANSSNVATTSIIVGRLDTGAAPTTLTINPITVNGVVVAPINPTLAIQGWVGSAGTINKAGGGVLQLNAQQVFTGTINVTAGGIGFGTLGNTGLAGGNAAGSRYAQINLGANTFLNLSNTDATIGSLAGSGTVINQTTAPANDNAGASGRTFNVGFDGSSSTFSGSFSRWSDALASSFQVNKIGAGTMTLTGASNTTNNLQVSQGGVTFSGGGTGTFANNIVLPTGTLTLDNSGTNVNHRLTGLLGTSGTLAIAGGTFRMIGNAAAPTSETVGTVTFNGVVSNPVGPSIVTLEANPAQPLTFTVGTTWGGVGVTSGLIRGISATAGNGNANFALGAIGLGAPTGAGTGANGTTTMPIRPDLLGDASAAGLGTGFITKDSATGFLRPIGGSELATTVFAGASTASTNYGLSAVAPLSAGGQFGSLTLNSGGGLSNAIAVATPDGLPIAPQVVSGGILAFTGNSGITAGRLQTANNVAFNFHALGNLTVNSVLYGTTGGFVKADSGTLTLGARNLYTGNTNINGGTLVLAGGDNTITVLATGGAPTTNYISVNGPGATLDLNGNNQVTTGLFTNGNGRYAGQAGTVTNTSGTTATFTLNMGSGQTVGGTIAGNLNFTKAGNNALTLTSNNTFTGATTIRANTLTLIDAGALSNTSAVNLFYGGLSIDQSGLNPIGDLNPTRVPAATPVNLRGGTVTLTSGGSVDSSATFNTVNVTAGHNTISVPQAPVGSTGAVNIGNLVLNADSTLNVTGGTGGFFSNSPGLNQSNLFITSINGVAIPATITNKILPANIISNSGEFTTYIQAGTTGSNNMNFGVVTMNGTTGPLGTITQDRYDTNLEQSGTTAALPASNANANIRTANNANPVVAMTANLPAGGANYNVLALRSSGITLGFAANTDVLNLTAGGLALTSGNATVGSATVNRGVLTAGGAPGTGGSTVPLYIHANGNSSTVNSVIANNVAGSGNNVRLVANVMANTLSLSAANTYTGGTVVNGGGTLAITSATGVMPAGGLTINNSTVTANVAANAIASANDVTINGGGALTLGNFANTLNSITFNNIGGTANPTIAVGTAGLTLPTANAITAVNDNMSTVPVISGGMLTLSNAAPVITTSTTANVPNDLSITAPIHSTGGAISKAGGGSILLAPAFAVASGVTTAGSNVVTFGSTAGITVGQLITGTGIPAGEYVTNILSGTQIEITTGTSVAAGTNTMTFTGSTFAGGLNLDSGTLILGNSSNFSGSLLSGPIGIGTLTMADGTALISDTAVRTLHNPVTLNGNITFGSTAGISNASTLAVNGVTLNGAVDLGAATSRSINVNSFFNTSTIGGIIGGAGSSLTKTGPGTLVLTGANTYDNGTFINGGVLQSNSTGLGTTGTITFGGGILQHAASTATDFSSRFATTSNQPFFIDTNNQTITYATALTSATGGSLGKFGAGTLILTNTAVYDGATIINAGTLQVGTGTSAGNIPANTNISNSGTLHLNRGAADLNVVGFINGSGGVTIDQGTLKPTATSALGGTLLFGAAPAGSSTLTNGTSTVGALDLTAADATFGALTAQTNSVNVNTINIGPARTLTINGNLTVGFNPASTTLTSTTKLTMNGGGSLVLNNPAAVVNVGLTMSQQAGIHTANTLDVTALSNVALGTVAAPITTVNVAFGQTTSGTLLLSNTANTIAATTLNVGHSNTFNGGPGTMTLGTGTNLINADTINIGFSKSNATLSFASQAPASPGTVVIANKAGTGGANITVGSHNGTGTGAVFTGTLDLRGHAVTVAANNVVVGFGNNNNNTGTASGVISFDTGTFTANTLSLGTETLNGTGSNTATAVLNIGGGAFTVSGATTIATNNATTGGGNITSTINLTGGSFSTASIAASAKTANSTGNATTNINVNGGVFTINPGGSFTLASQATAGTAVGNFNVTAGLATINADILDGGGTTTTVLNLDGGTLDMTGKNIGNATNIINTLTFASGTLKNVGEINGGANISKTTVGTLVLDGTNTWTGNTDAAAGTLIAVSPLALPGYNVAGKVSVQTPATLAVRAGGAGEWLTADIDAVLGAAGATFNANSTFGIEVLAPNTFTYPNDIAGTTAAKKFVKLGAGTATLSGASTHSGPTTVAAGTLKLTGSIAASSGVIVNTGATFEAAPPAPVLPAVATVVNINGLTVGAAAGDAAKARIVGAAIGESILVTPTLSLTGTGSQIDVQKQVLIYNYTAGDTVAANALVRAQIIAARNTGNWDGASGITSSSIGINVNDYAVGYGDSPLVAPGGTFRGAAVDADAVIVRYTMMGDSNLDGVVDFADLVAVAQNYNQASVWTSGDFDYNGTTEFADLVAVAQHYNQSAAGPVPGASADFNADWAAALTMVPEPGAMSLLALGSLLLMRRGARRRAA